MNLNIFEIKRSFKNIMTSSVVPYDKLQTDTGGDENVNQVKKLVEKAVADYDPQAEEK